MFNEIVSFQLEQSCIAETKLRVAIWDHDFFGEDDFNGEGIVDLSKISLNSGTYTDWFMLQLEVFNSKKFNNNYYLSKIRFKTIIVDLELNLEYRLVEDIKMDSVQRSSNNYLQKLFTKNLLTAR